MSLKKSNDSNDDDIKVILVGESGTGKTSLINCIQGKQFFEGAQMSSMICSFVKINMEILNNKYIINLWDTIGQEKFRSLTKIFLNDSKIVIFVYDITKEKTFEELSFWFDLIEKELGPEPIKGIAANKQDLIEEQKISDNALEEYAKQKNVDFSYTTATNIDGFKNLLEKLLLKYLEKIGKLNKNSKRIKGKKLKKEKDDKHKSKSKKC